MIEGILFFIFVYGIFYFIDFAEINSQTVIDYLQFVNTGLESNYMLLDGVSFFLLAFIYAIYKKSYEIVKALSYCFTALFIYVFFYFIYSAYLFALLHYNIENEILFKSAFIIAGIFFLPFLLSSRDYFYRTFTTFPIFPRDFNNEPKNCNESEELKNRLSRSIEIENNFKEYLMFMLGDAIHNFRYHNSGYNAEVISFVGIILRCVSKNRIGCSGIGNKLNLKYDGFDYNYFDDRFGDSINYTSIQKANILHIINILMKASNNMPIMDYEKIMIEKLSGLPPYEKHKKEEEL